MTFTRNNPFVVRQGVQDEIRHVFDRIFGDIDGDQSNIVTSQWAPRVDIREDDERFVIFVDVPGVDPKDVEIHMDKGILTIKGERVGAVKEENKRYSRIERSHGLFHRRFALPDSADADGITASGKHGVLEIGIPKKARTQPRRIQVQ